jgi:peptidoglycan/xylan/chitin deacetylase (PgdA/CDA1 family)
MRAVLTYHSIDGSGSPISVDETTFRRQLSSLVSGAVVGRTLEDLLGSSPADNAVALTFDDGYANFAEVAWPLLRDHGVPATLFVVTDFVGRSRAWNDGPGYGLPRLPLLDWETIGWLAEEGVVVAAHTRTHPDLRRLSAAALADELEGAASRIEQEIGRRPKVFAYPYGHFDAAVVSAARSVYPLACTAEFRILREEEDTGLIPRLDAHYFRPPGILKSWGTGHFQGYLWLRARGRSLRSAVYRRWEGPRP